MTLTLNPKIKLNHPLADQISVQDTKYHHCTPGESYEIAFFKDGEWVLEPLPPFEQYAEEYGGDTLVYGYVPKNLITAFLDVFSSSAA